VRGQRPRAGHTARSIVVGWKRIGSSMVEPQHSWRGNAFTARTTSASPTCSPAPRATPRNSAESLVIEVISSRKNCCS
jgi:hypothetical protein